jgi:hypothetical protein
MDYVETIIVIKEELLDKKITLELSEFEEELLESIEFIIKKFELEEL